MYIDSHVQLQFADYDKDRAMVIGNAKKAGVKQFVVPGVDHNSCRSAVLLAKNNPGVVFAAVGFHPYEAPHNPDLSYLETLLKTEHVVAVGECGLDYHEYKGEVAGGRKDVQKRLLEEQLLLAKNYHLPVIIHCRDAWDDIFTVLQTVPGLRGVFHCFSGGLQDLRAAKALGFYVGIDGNVTYSKQLQSMVPQIPPEMLLLETDAPYLTPVPHRGERNEPKYIPLIAKNISGLRGVPVTELEKQTTDNAKKLFGI